MWKNRGFQLLAGLVALPLIASCGGVLESARPAVHTWWLQPLEVSTAAEEPRPGVSLEVGVVPGLDTDLILTMNPNGRLNHYAGARWADHLPDVLDSLVRRTLANSGLYAEVHGRRYSGPGGCSLHLEAQRFWSRVDAENVTQSVEIMLAGIHACGDSRWPVRHSASIPVRGNHMPEVIGAYQRGLNEVLRGLLAQLERQVPSEP